MAIGWKCKYGYISGSYNDFFGNPSFDRFIPTDEGYYFFSDKCEPVIPLAGQTYNNPTVRYRTPIECGNTLVNILGENFYRFYTLPFPASPTQYAKSQITEAMTVVPSAFKMCPNLVDYINQNQQTAIWSAIYFTTLKKLMLISGAIYDVVNGGESLVRLTENPPFPFFPAYTNYQAFFSMFCFTGFDGTVKSLLNLSTMFNVLVLATNLNNTGLTINRMMDSTAPTYFSQLFKDFVQPDYIVDDNPYTPGGTTEPGGGEGDFDGSSDPVDFPELPALSSVDTGFITLFNPSSAELRGLAAYMWGDLFDVSTWKKIFADPMDAILGLSIVPVAVPNGGIGTIKVGNIATDVTMNKAASQFVAVDCGTINVNEYWGAYLDYEPFTKAELYLPYIGTHPIAVDDIMGKAVHVVYHVDILSGACCAYVKCGDSVLYSFVGQCSCSIPITGNDWTNVINGALSIAASIGTMVATGGASAPMAITDIASTAVNSMKPSIEKSGSISGMGGIMGLQRPYLILTRPRQAVPKNQNRYTGYPSFITQKLSDISGYTEVDSIHLENIPATEDELTEIESLLKAGVIF